MTPYSREYVERIEAENRAMREELDAAEKRLAEADARLASLELAAQPDGPPTMPPSGWRELVCNDTEGKPPFDGNPVLIATNHSWRNRVHRVIWTDAIHGKGIFSWAIEDCKFGPYPLRGYTQVTHWRPLPPPPTEAGTPALNTPPRSAETVALSIALRALALIGRTSRDEDAREAADKALADIAALAPRAGDGR